MNDALVTGATGFVGRALCERLRADGVRVRALARAHAAGPWHEMHVADLREATPGRALSGVDTVFHLAARTHATGERAGGDPGAYRRANVDATRNLLAAALDAGVGCCVFFSSVKAMGEATPSHCLDERAPCRPTTPYGISKLEAERLVLDAGASGALRASVLRLPLVYGPGVKGNLEAMLRAVRRGRFPPIADTRNRRSLVHAQDAAAAAMLAARSPEAAGEVFLVTDGAVYSTAQMLSMMRAALGLRAPRWHLPLAALRVAARVGDALGAVSRGPVPLDSSMLEKLVASACYDSRKLETMLGFRPRWGLADALPEMVRALEGGS